MKKNRVLRLGLLALVLTLVTASLVSGTLAKYVTTVNGTGTVTVAKWKVQVGTANLATTEGNLEATSFDLVSTLDADTGVADLKIAPGRTGSFALAYNTLTSEVAHQLVITLTKGPNFPAQLKFFTDATRATEITGSTGASFVLPAIDINVGGDSNTVTVYWGWDFEVNTDTNTSDTALGKLPQSYTMSAQVVATQVDGTVYNP